jgi:hypothetical protein
MNFEEPVKSLNRQAANYLKNSPPKKIILSNPEVAKNTVIQNVPELLKNEIPTSVNKSSAELAKNIFLKKCFLSENDFSESYTFLQRAKKTFNFSIEFVLNNWQILALLAILLLLIALVYMLGKNKSFKRYVKSKPSWVTNSLISLLISLLHISFILLYKSNLAIFPLLWFSSINFFTIFLISKFARRNKRNLLIRFLTTSIGLSLLFFLKPNAEFGLNFVPEDALLSQKLAFIFLNFKDLKLFYFSSFCILCGIYGVLSDFRYIRRLIRKYRK